MIILLSCDTRCVERAPQVCVFLVAGHYTEFAEFLLVPLQSHIGCCCQDDAVWVAGLL